MKLKQLIKPIAFLLIFFLLLNGVTFVFQSGATQGIGVVDNFYKAPPNSLDAVYVGASSAMKFWNAMLAWEQYGICVQTLSTNRTPFWITKDYIIEARKTQPDALYIVNINTLGNTAPATYRAVIDAFPFSLQKLRMIKHMCDYGDLSLGDRLEYYFRIIRYHTRWNELTPEDFSSPIIPDEKGVVVLHDTTHITKQYNVTEEIGTIEPKMADALTDLLDYCDEEQLKILFVIVPQFKPDNTLETFNAIKAVIEGRGYTVLDLIKDPEALDFDLTQDFYDNSHTNVHGSAKATFHLSKYLIDVYGFEDKRGYKDYLSWDEALEKYNAANAPYFLDIEHIPFANTANMAAPEINVARTDEGTTVSWIQSEGAEGYLVYCKIKSLGEWKLVADTSDLSCFVQPPEGRYRSFYTVVPYRDNNGTREYGSFVREGVRVQ